LNSEKSVRDKRKCYCDPAKCRIARPQYSPAILKTERLVTRDRESLISGLPDPY
jgi:hypothetical protein